MDDRTGIFAGDDPFALAQEWVDAAAATEPNDPNAVSLATVDADGLPDVRIVLLKEIGGGGFVFFTNYLSAKGRQIAATGKGALCWHSKTLRRQIRARGAVRRIAAAESDAYFASRPLGSRLGAWASRQSEPLESRAALLAQVEAARAEHGEAPPRPPHWGGFRLYPDEIEFWADGEFRLHDRFRWQRSGVSDNWLVSRLNP